MSQESRDPEVRRGSGEVRIASVTVTGDGPEGRVLSGRPFRVALEMDSLAGAPSQIDLKVAPQYQKGKEVAAASGCLACHKIGDNGAAGPGPNLTKVGARLPRTAIARTLINPTAPMPSFKNLPPQKFRAAVEFLSQLK